jgi:hypothetical protein
MSNLKNLYRELNAILEDVDQAPSNITAGIDPHLIDQLNAYAVSRELSLAQAIMNVLELFMMAAAERAWSDIDNELQPDLRLRQGVLNIVLQHFVSLGVASAEQRAIEGPIVASASSQFRRVG